MTSQEFLDDLWGPSEQEEPLKSSTFNSVKLAKYFQDKLISSYWYRGFGIVNLRALSGQLAQWKRANVSAEMVHNMIDLYMSDYTMRGKVPGWQDFVYQRDKLATTLSNTGDKSQAVDKWDQREADYDEDAAMRDYLARRKN